MNGVSEEACKNLATKRWPPVGRSTGDIAIVELAIQGDFGGIYKVLKNNPFANYVRLFWGKSRLEICRSKESGVW